MRLVKVFWSKNTVAYKQHGFFLQGLLWNLSSAEDLKQELMNTALIALTKNVLVPFTNYSESEQTYVDPEVFHSATGCIRYICFFH